MTVIIVDIEATDKDPKTAKVIELGELALPEDPLDLMMLSNSIEAPYSLLFGTTEPIKWGALAVHHIIPADLEGMPEYNSAAYIEHCALGGVDYIVGHNIDYDAEVLGFKNTKEYGVRRICTLALARGLLPDLDAHNQTALVYYIGHCHGDLEASRARLQNSHRASDDVSNCAYVLQFLLCKAVEQGHVVDTWEQVWRLSEDCRIPKRITFGKHAGELIENVPYSYVKWYRGTDNQDPYLVEAFRRAGLTR